MVLADQSRYSGDKAYDVRLTLSLIRSSDDDNADMNTKSATLPTEFNRHSFTRNDTLTSSSPSMLSDLIRTGFNYSSAIPFTTHPSDSIDNSTNETGSATDLSCFYFADYSSDSDMSADCNSSFFSASNDTVFYALVKQPLHMVIILFLAYGAVFFLNLVGNLCVMAVVYKDERLHCPTYVFIVNLAIADILIAIICIPVNLASSIYSGECGAVFCVSLAILSVLRLYPTVRLSVGFNGNVFLLMLHDLIAITLHMRVLRSYIFVFVYACLGQGQV